ncbi:alpha/beta fold hydrolase [uncultured Phycicoccus sp.]|uniref:alpha/beta fold hydrolase n=1 Tax=uncultured Phycicoccus sp. TaxID=661422 RepID=UPI00345B7DFE
MGGRASPGTDLAVDAQSRRLGACLPTGAPLVLVGHSASCPVVVDTACRVPEVAGLVLVAPVTDTRARTWPRMVTQWLRTAPHERLWEVPVLTPQYRATGLSSMSRGMNQVRRYRTDVGLSAVTAPTHVIRGSRDRIASEDWCALLARRPPVDLVTVPDAAHMVPLTHPLVVVESVERLRDGAADDRHPGP